MNDETPGPVAGEENPEAISRKLQQKRTRREAEERKRKEQASAARRSGILTTVIALAVAALVVGLVLRERTAEEQAANFGPAAQAAGCEPVETFEEMKGEHIETGEELGPESYNSLPPTSGPMWEPVLPTGFIDRVLALPEPLHNLEHGQVIVYHQDLDDDEIEGLKSYARDARDAVIVAQAPEGVEAPITLTAWRKLQSCDEPSSAAIDEFRKNFQGKAPEGGPPFEG